MLSQSVELEMHTIRTTMNAVYELLLKDHFLAISWFYRPEENTIHVLTDKNTDPEQPYQRIGIDIPLSASEVKMLRADAVADKVYDAYLSTY